MGEPFQLPDGTVVSNYDADVIEVSGPGGGVVRVARAAAPPALQQAVSQREQGGGPGALVPAAPGGGMFANIDPNTPGPGVNIPKPGPAAALPDPAQTSESGVIAGTPMPANPMAAVDARIAELRQQGATRGPGGMATRTATSTTRMPAAAAEQVQDMQTPIDESVAEQQLAVEEQGAVEERGLGEVSKLHAQQGQRIEREVTDQETLRQGYETRFAAEQQKLADLNQRAQVEIDPKRLWKEKSTGEKVLGAISMAIGAFVNARSEGRVANTPQQIIEAAVQRDIDAQLENRNRAERDVGRQAGMVGLLGDKYSDDIQKRQAAMVLANEAVAKQIDGIAAGMQSEAAKAKALQLSAQMRQGNAQRAQEFAAQIAGSETTQTQQVPVAGGNRGQREADALSAAAYGPGATFDHKSFVPASVAATGEYRAANDPAEAAKINSQSATVQQMLRKADQIEAAAKNGGKLSPQKRAEVAALYASLTLDVKNAEQAGALDAGTQQITADILGPKPTDITSVANTIPLFKQTVRAKHMAVIQNSTHPIDPTTVPLRARQQGGAATGIATQPPATRPLAEDSPE